MKTRKNETMQIFNVKQKNTCTILMGLVLIILLIVSYKIIKKAKRLNTLIVEIHSSLTSKELNRNDIGTLILDKNGLSLLLMNNDDVSRGIYHDKQWEPHLQHALKQLVKPKDKVLVLGAHIGTHALLLSKIVGNEGKVSIFEANPYTLKFLKANILLNNAHNTTLYPKAAYSKNTSLKFVAVSKGNTGISHIDGITDLSRPEDNQDNMVTVEAVSIDSLSEIKSINVLQMDIEGAEAEAVYGARKLIDNSPNLIVFQEWSPFWIKDVDSYLEFWRSRGYKIAHIAKEGLKEMTDKELKEIDQVNQIDILIAKDLDHIIASYKPLAS
jgi:FkbM family methyltransferase